MKFFSVFILFVCVLSASFSNWLMIAAYTLNQHYIAEELCVNKKNPACHCNGHCYLGRQISKEEKPGSPLNTSSSEKFEMQLFCIELPAADPAFNTSKKIFTGQTSFFISQQFIQSLFQPPRA